MIIKIEKELCMPFNGEQDGPYYHVVGYEDDRRVNLSPGAFTDIGEAARFAERKLDLDALEIAYKNNPNCFSSVIDPLKDKQK